MEPRQGALHDARGGGRPLREPRGLNSDSCQARERNVLSLGSPLRERPALLTGAPRKVGGSVS